jgi:hypothetical protein
MVVDRATRFQRIDAVDNCASETIAEAIIAEATRASMSENPRSMQIGVATADPHGGAHDFSLKSQILFSVWKFLRSREPRE